MPKTRLDVDRTSKVAEILAVGERQVLSGGYAKLSMIGIARELGVAQNSIYWYFPSKDDLFIAVGQRLTGRTIESKPRRFKSLVHQVNWFVNRLDEFYPLVAALHERGRTSKRVDRFRRDFETALRGMLAEALTPYVPADRLELAVDSFSATVEGLLLRRVPRKEREAVVGFLIESFTGDAGAPAAEYDENC